MTSSRERAGIEASLLDWMAEARTAPWPRPADDARFEELALRLFAHQFEANEAYGRFCRGRGVTPEKVERSADVPAVPTGAFKEVALRCFPPAQTLATFRTSGTSGTSGTGGRPGEAAARRGLLHLDTFALYDASLMATLDGLFLPDLAPGERTTLRVLAPSAEEAPDSSLSHMFARLLEARGDDESRFDVGDGALAGAELEAALGQAVGAGRPVALCGTAFAFVNWLDDLAGRRFALPAGSRIMETGGFKGRAREVSRGDLLQLLSETLGVPPARIVNQYGMTELGSQFYDSVLVDPDGPRRKLGPPWARVRILDPATGREVADGEVGMLTIHDLANTGSVAAVQTADLGRRVALASEAGSPAGFDGGFEVIGRAEGAEERGCSIAADLMLGPARG
ncbi:MAG: AMP-binding protein [Myxococcota bacterium]